MRTFEKVAPESEAFLEHLVQLHPQLIEDGLIYVTHQLHTGTKRLDVLLKDKDHSLVVAELKINQDDDMLLQAVDYYDYVARNVERIARLFKEKGIDPVREIRLFLVAPSFTQTLINRCKWFKFDVELFSFQCIKLEDNEIIPVFAESVIPTAPPIPTVYTVAEHVNYIQDKAAKEQAISLLDEIRSSKPGATSIDPIRGAISLKVNGRVFAYFHPRRTFFIVSTYDDDGQWVDYPIKGVDAFIAAKPIIFSAQAKICQA